MSKFNIPLFDLNYGVEEETAILNTIRSNWISMGPQAKKFEELFAEKCGAKYAVSVANCTGALHLALMALDIGPGDEVIVPSLTFVATANCVKYVGATPVFADIVSYEDLTISCEDIVNKITHKTKAIIPMHFAGYGSDMNNLKKIASKYNLKLIEDACHGPLSEYEGQKLGSIGDLGCFSFFSNKNISTGEGGMLITNNQELAQKLKLLRSHGMTTTSFERSSGHATEYDVVEAGYNYRMDDMRASLGIAQLKKLQQDLVKRSVVRRNYIEHLSDINGIYIPYINRSEFSSNYIFPIVLKNSNRSNRDRIRKTLASAGIQTSVHYPAVHKFSSFKSYESTDMQKTEYVTDNEITLPMYSSLSNDQVKFIAENLKSAI